MYVLCIFLLRLSLVKWSRFVGPTRVRGCTVLLWWLSGDGANDDDDGGGRM